MRRTKAEAGETRETILDSAETVFLEHGVNQSTLNQIAEHAGVTRGAIYFHFKDKIELYQDVVERVRLPQDDLLTKAMHCENSNPLDIALDAGVFCLENFAGDPRNSAFSPLLPSVVNMWEKWPRFSSAFMLSMTRFMRCFCV
jgi:AcrR family transcriptional regulator